MSMKEPWTPERSRAALRKIAAIAPDTPFGEVTDDLLDKIEDLEAKLLAATTLTTNLQEAHADEQARADRAEAIVDAIRDHLDQAAEFGDELDPQDLYDLLNGDTDE